MIGEYPSEPLRVEKPDLTLMVVGLAEALDVPIDVLCN